MGGPSIIESRLACKAKRNGAVNDSYNADQFPLLGARGQRHEVNDFRCGAIGEKASDQNIALGGIHLLTLHTIQLRTYRKGPAMLGIQQSGEDCGRVELGEAEEIDRRVNSYQSGRTKISNHSVVFDRLGTHLILSVA